ncbi:chemotaxis response regulator protein-glutamate methylesterase [uncultured Oscillibacter sp.]|uniref:protein-glutamate methylesterase/protein-glutamine glutaminase n=1 Tax=uncultured Oscillibacter sp. TaxID=876091 RepID=UPI0025CC0C43|nr:chemotaxis response regulator protein-glutamate methylesterase [uncultured Oscillibacter sp.]
MAMSGKVIRVMVVDDSAVARSYLISGLSAKPNIQIAGFAVDAADALQKVGELRPDVITMDVEMPGMGGIELIRKLLPAYRVPVILVSSLNLRVFDALDAGAVDFVRKPDGTQSKAEFINTLAQKIVVSAYAKVRPGRPARAARAEVTAEPTAPLGPRPILDGAVIGLGASTGGTEATLEVLRRLPSDIPPMVIVQHMPPGFTKMYAERLDRICAMEVREAVDGDELHRGLALVAPADFQCRVLRSGSRYRVACKPGEKVSGHRPSVDVLFHSMAENVKGSMVGIIMTGMGRDGADGLLAMRKAGAYTIGQDKESSVVYGMPMVAFDIGAVQTQASSENIAGVLLRRLREL